MALDRHVIIERKFGFGPVADAKTEILILGSLPSDESLSKRKYYAKPSNDFWKLLEAVLNVEMANLTYEGKIEELLGHHIGLWDVLHSCARPGSMDKDITKQELNDFAILKQIAPNLRLVCFNGKTAGESEELLGRLGYATKVLPSSSGANRRDQADRLRCWKTILAP